MLSKVAILSVFCLLAGGINYGTALTNLPVQIVTKYALITHFDPDNPAITSLIEVSFCVGAALGSSVSQLITRKMSYPKALMMFFGLAILMNVVQIIPIHWIYLVSCRTVSGFITSGINSIAPLQVASQLSAHHREKAMMMYDFSLNAGVTLAYLIHFGISFDYNYWQFTFLAPILCNITGALVAMTLIKASNAARQIQTLKKFVEDQEEKEPLVHESITVQHSASDYPAPMSLDHNLTNQVENAIQKPHLSRKQLNRIRYVAFAIGAFQMLTGIDAIVMYSSDIFETEFGSVRAGILGSVLLGVVNLVTIVVSAQFVGKVRRRKMLLFGIIGVSVCNISIGFCYLLNINKREVYIMALTVLFQIFYCSGPEPLVFMMFSEMFPEEHKNQLNSLAYSTNWVANILVVFTFQFFFDHLWVLYFFYAVCTLGFGLSGVALAPETCGKSLEEIEQQLLQW
ncbi:Hexose_transporter [Hexamita inflata]|uniref:Hexose transporter n=1 Tax=Hexamita inflata TaxID=28002 RepID=A0AA86PYV9_9EUKA|nr:Hexose transporter [Hexamita inflata]